MSRTNQSMQTIPGLQKRKERSSSSSSPGLEATLTLLQRGSMGDQRAGRGREQEVER